ncbi:MAG: MarP family serine protease [Actinomycetota bacterium]|nr:MarP family serine protease [Actinomycetota bacterium]
MTAIDWIIVAFTLLMAVWGYAQGLVVGALSLLGFLGGGLIGSRLGPLLLDEGSRSPYAPVFALVGAFLLGGILASVLESVGFQLRRRLRGGLGLADGVAGALLLACAGLGLAWMIGAIALQTPGAREYRRDIQRSAILSRLNEVFPPRSLLNALARFDPFPSIEGPAPEVPPPTSRIARDPDVRQAAQSTVRILGTACGLGVEGSGWIAADGVVVTNAHVVAGQDDTTVQLAGDGPRHDADAIWFDSRNDLAILRASGLSGARPLAMNEGARVGTSGAVVGYPGNGPLDVRPARLGETSTVISQDAYGRGPVRRRVTALRGTVRSGNSGGPMIDGRGRVLTTVFASTTGGGPRGGYGVPDSIVREALGRADERVGTGPCTR